MAGVGISLISWVNDPDRYLNMVIPSFVSPYQIGGHGTQFICVPPDAHARNIGAAYNKAAKYIEHPLRVYVHQDVKAHDRFFFEKLAAMFEENPDLGAVGVIGSVVDTGGGFFHAAHADKRGIRDASFFPERCEVKTVDGFMLATNLDIPFSEEYESTHMAVEDYCMAVRAAGKQVWVIDSLFDHLSGGLQNDAYWRSVESFQRKWRASLPPETPTTSVLMNRVSAAETITTDLFIQLCTEAD